MKIVLLSDTHGFHDQIKVPDGDMVIHAGDLTMRGKNTEVDSFLEWFGKLPHKYKVFVPGNHDWYFTDHTPQCPDGVTMLLDSSIKIEGFKIYGSPWQPWFFDWAFNFSKRDNGDESRKTWAKIPDDTNILITHGPPHGILDACLDGRLVGCPALRDRIKELRNLDLHVFGHIHEAKGTWQYEKGWPLYVNASICGYPNYSKLSDPIVVELEGKEEGYESFCPVCGGTCSFYEEY